MFIRYEEYHKHMEVEKTYLNAPLLWFNVK